MKHIPPFITIGNSNCKITKYVKFLMHRPVISLRDYYKLCPWEFRLGYKLDLLNYPYISHGWLKHLLPKGFMLNVIADIKLPSARRVYDYRCFRVNEFVNWCKENNYPRG